MRILPASLFFALLTVVPACKSTGCCETCVDPQAVVEQIAKEHPECTRLTVHCTPAGETAAIACASTAADKKGKPSDPEDLRAMQTGQTVVLDEAGALDVTVPICAKDGKHMAACGVTLKGAGSRDQQIAAATAIAKKVESSLGDCCGGACCKK